MAEDKKRDWDFAGIAGGYEKYLVPVLSMWTEPLFEKTDLENGEDVLDFACGTGSVIRTLTDHLDAPGRLVGLDVEPAMLDVARSRAKQLPVDVQWHQADAADMPFADESFDVAYCQQGLQFMDDSVAALSEAHRVLRPNGRLALSVWSHLDDSPHYAVLTEALQNHIGDRAAAAMRAPFDALSSPGKLRRCIESAGFRGIDVEGVTHRISYPGAEEFFRREIVSWLADAVGDLSDRSRKAIVTDLQQGLQRYIDADGLEVPMRALVARGTK